MEKSRNLEDINKWDESGLLMVQKVGIERICRKFLRIFIPEFDMHTERSL